MRGIGPAGGRSSRESIIYCCASLRTISLHDTLSGQVLPLQPRHAGHVGMYVCGPTVYDRIHVGNARPFVVFSLLKRFLVHEGYNVTFVANITDVNDKIYDAARAAGVASAELAAQMATDYVADTDGLGLGRPDHEPRASESIGAIVELIERLIEGGHAYAAQGDVYFAVRSYPAYGALSHRDVDEMDQGEDVEGSAHKRDPLDFALWKAHKPGEDTVWEAPWGRGRPGWHIECSAMAESLLGVGFEIHGGGSDLIFPHHENEEAQTHAAHGAPLARLWVHNGMLRMGDMKMSKSAGSVYLLRDALAAHGRDAVVMYFCEGHYRQPVAYDEERLAEAAARVKGIREAARGLREGPSAPWSAPLREKFFDALATDFNTPRALAVLSGWAHEANRARQPVGDADLREMLAVLGLETLLDRAASEAPGEVVVLLEARERARAGRDYPEADRLRAEIVALGWEVRDGPGGPELVALADP
jgi:cysteinyl-tRNA synthetase